MPSGKIHDSVALISVIPIYLAGNYLFKFNQPELYTLVLVSVFSQMMFGPDLDAQSCQYKRWGLLKWIWLPYRKIFTHRSRFSHGIILGPIFRCIYLFIVCILFFSLLRLFIIQLLGIDIIFSLKPGLSEFIVDSKYSDFIPFTAPLIIGLFVGAAIHTFTDKIFSFFKNLI